jgi:hypothetical protein
LPRRRRLSCLNLSVHSVGRLDCIAVSRTHNKPADDPAGMPIVVLIIAAFIGAGWYLCVVQPFGAAQKFTRTQLASSTWPRHHLGQEKQVSLITRYVRQTLTLWLPTTAPSACC